MTASMTAHARTIRTMFASVLPAALTDKSVPTLNGVHLTIGTDRTVVAQATDRYAIARYELTASDRDGIAAEAADGDQSIIVPADAVKAIIRAIPATDRYGSASLVIDGNTLRVETGTVSQTFNGTDRDYPAISKLMSRPDQPGPPAPAFGMTVPVLETITKCVKALGKTHMPITFTTRGENKAFDINVAEYPEWSCLATTARI